MALQRSQEEKRHILLGNGFSIAFDASFRYADLLPWVRQRCAPVDALIEACATKDLEELMQNVYRAREIVERVCSDGPDVTCELDAVERSLREGFVFAVSQVHPGARADVDDLRLECCSRFLGDFASIFTTNYDLLLYWA